MLRLNIGVGFQGNYADEITQQQWEKHQIVVQLMPVLHETGLFLF